MKTLPHVDHLALVGPTASGKSALAFALAQELGDVEIVSLDAMQVYRGMSIGTAKPTTAEQAAVVHHLIDVADPADDWSVQRTQAGARAALAGIEARGHRALFVGGTGLYVRAVVDDLRFPGEDPQRRAELEAATEEVEGLRHAYRELEALDPVAAARIEPLNRRRIVRALEVIHLTGKPFSSFGPGVDQFGPPTVAVRMIGVWLPRALHAEHIAARFATMVDAGLVDEVRSLAELPGGLSRTAEQAIGYRELFGHLRGDVPTLEVASDLVVRRTRAFARRQRMWFRRDPRITWLGTGDDPRSLLGIVRDLWAVNPTTVRGMTLVRLSKLHGTGNDFLVQQASEPLGADIARALCDRHRGVGADGLITIGPGAHGADCTMTLRNADGGLAELSGNGLRCLASVAARSGLGTADLLVVDTAAGRREITLVRDAAGAVVFADVDMGAVTFVPAEIGLDAPSADGLEATFHGVTYRGDAAGMGNPHLVLFVDDPDTARVVQHGSRLEHDERFPNRANVEFVVVEARDRLRMRVWERGVGETLSCGTGACAAAAVAHRRGLVDAELTVAVPGGDLRVQLGATIRLGGPVMHVFDTEVDLTALGCER